MNERGKYGPSFDELGFLASPATGSFRHRFGGDTWRVVDQDPLVGGPSLLLVLDLDDPALSALRPPGLSELPLCSYVNASAWEGRQRFRIDVAERAVLLSERQSDSRESLDAEDRFPNPLKETRLTLVKMSREDLPLDEDQYWAACDHFVGGDRFIRVIGAPLWLDRPVDEVCSCGAGMAYVASLGYEDPGGVSALEIDRAFFFGEAGLYFFWCSRCLEVSVIAQTA